MESKQPFTLAFTNESILFTDNTLHSFRSIVNPPIVLAPNSWEVGLSKMIIPQSRQLYWSPTNFVLEISLRNPQTRKKEASLKLNFSITHKLFSSLDTLILMLDDLIVTKLLEEYQNLHLPYDISREKLPGVQFEITQSSNRVTISAVNYIALQDTTDQFSYLTVNEGLEFWHVLGFHNFDLHHRYRLPIRANQLPSQPIEASTLIVTAPNLILNQFIGDKEQALLELIPYIINSPNEYSIFHDSYPLYKPIHGGYINNILIEILDIDNKPIHFESGKIQLVLHFKPCHNTIKW